MTLVDRPPLGAHLDDAGGVTFRCFASARACAVRLVGEDGAILIEQDLHGLGDGYFEGHVRDAAEGSLYYFLVDGKCLPDPYARELPQGVHGPGRVARSRYEFRHAPPSRSRSELVIYELHVGTFTEAGTFASALARLPALAELGVTAIQLMPVASFEGERGWGYDGVALYAPHVAYGSPDDLRRLVDEAHGLGLNVILDVVYNHFGPAGNYLAAYAADYFSEEVSNVWGQAPNFELPALRQLVLDNARYWFEEFGFDGLRLDATHAIVDRSPTHVLEDLVAIARSCRPERWLIAEDDRNLASLITHTGLTALWADDFHHQVRATFTGERAGYFRAFEPGVRGLALAINSGWIYSGQLHPVRNQRRGTSAAELPAETLVYCIQNHDQVGNRAVGDRFPPGESFRAASVLLLFLPMTPLLFMGQEWAATTPFLYFTDHEPELGRLVTEGRRREFAEFMQAIDADSPKQVPDPQDRETFVASKLRWDERGQPEQAATLALYRALLALRRNDEVWSCVTREGLVAQALDAVLVVRRTCPAGVRVLLLNLGERPLSLTSLAAEVGLRSYSVQIASSRVEELLPPRTAVVLAA